MFGLSKKEKEENDKAFEEIMKDDATDKVEENELVVEVKKEIPVKPKEPVIL